MRHHTWLWTRLKSDLYHSPVRQDKITNHELTFTNTGGLQDGSQVDGMETRVKGRPGLKENKQGEKEEAKQTNHPVRYLGLLSFLEKAF